MSDRKVSPLLDAMEIGECFAKHDGVSCYYIRHPESGREFVLKHISVPASQEQVQALLLTGAYASEAEAADYFRQEAEALVQEVEARKKLLDCPYILPFLGVQMEPKEEGTGYDVYAVLPKRSSLQTFLNDNAVSHLRGINMGIDLCVALAALREEGYVHGNLKPGNVFFSDTGRFLLGDFGLISTQDLQYAVLPEQYRSSYSAPETKDILGGLNATIDLYSLGMILYRIYNGNHAPFEDEQTPAKAAEERRLAGEELPAPIYADYELTEIIRKAIANDPAERYQAPDEMRLDLEQYMRRNAVSDHLIVPPLVTDGEPLSPEQTGEPAEPVHFADPDQLDDEFKAAFTPDAGRKKRKDRKKDRKHAEEAEAPAETAEPEAEEKQTPEAEQKPGTEEESASAEKKPEAKLPDEPAPVITPERRKQAEQARKRRKRKKRAWTVFLVLLVLALGFIALYEFTGLGQGLYHYFVSVDSLEVTDVTADSMKLRLTTNIDPDDFTAVCQDAYGNSFDGVFHEGVADFTGLTPGTQYTLRVSLDGLHKLSGKTSTSAATVPQTEVLTFSASIGSEEGAVLLSLVTKDENMEPESWTLLYGKAGGEEKQTSFTGHSFQVSGLDTGDEYSFRLVGSEDFYLIGQLETQFTPLPALQVNALNVDSVRDGTAFVSWECVSEPPEEWLLTCTDEAGSELPVTVNPAQLNENSYYCSATVENVVPGVSYELKLSALGMYQPLITELKDLTIQIDRFDAVTAPGTITLTWNANREPDEGWIVTSRCGVDLETQQAVHGTTCVLSVLPEVEYELSIAASDGAPVQGYTNISVRSSSTQRFSYLGIQGRGSTIGTYYTPEEGEFDLNNPGAGTVSFKAGDDITFLITAKGRAQESEELVTIQYVVRDDRNRIVNVTEKTAEWNSIWHGDKWYDRIPWIPAEPGSYSFTAYINSCRMTTISFKVEG